MATFKVGQRVRIVGPLDLAFAWTGPPPIGRCGVIVGRATDPMFFPWIVHYEGNDCCGMKNEFGASHAAFRSCELEPLTDVKADEFIERIKNLRPYEEPKRPDPMRYLDIERMPSYDRVIGK